METRGNRHVIKRHTPVAGGVHFTSTPQGEVLSAVIVVAMRQQDIDAYSHVWRDALDRSKVQGRVHPDKVLSSVKDAVRKAMPYSKSGASAVLDSAAAENGLTAFPQGHGVALSRFIGKNGVCRHQALLVGVLVEQLIKQGYLDGTVNFVRYMRRGKGRLAGRLGGHAIALFTPEDGSDPVVIDPAGNYCGTVNDAPERKRRDYEMLMASLTADEPETIAPFADEPPLPPVNALPAVRAPGSRKLQPSLVI